MSSYFSLPSFARAKQNKEQLERTNPGKPVLSPKDEEFLKKQVESQQSMPEVKNEPATKIAHGGEEQEAEESTSAGADQVALPAEKPESGSVAQGVKQDGIEVSADDPPEQVFQHETAKPDAPAAKGKRQNKSTGIELPSQEEAEAATRGFNVGGDEHGNKPPSQQGDKRTWTSYLPSIGSGEKKGKDKSGKPVEEEDSGDAAQSRSWTQYATDTYSSLPSMQSLATSFTRSKYNDSKPEPVYNEDGTVNEEKTKEKQEREVSVLLDNLNMSSINNRVFSFSDETHKIYERFAQVLKDTMEGGPTAYEDMEKLMKDAGPTLERQFQSMPPFVQTLVKSLPAKLGTTLGPELMVAVSEKPGADMKTKLGAGSKQGATASGSTTSTGEKSKEREASGKAKQKRTIPGLKSILSKEGAVATMLRNILNFLRVRFPFLASTTNVVMSLAVFILMLVFWYCHKRGRESRLAREQAALGEDGTGEKGEVEGEDEDFEASEDDDEDEEEVVEGATVGEKSAETKKSNVLDQPEPSEVPLPDKA
ncbi:hypothetical protein Tdes44962_MAKER03444 [Teratosphaeria destructans]|uniref:Ring-like domain-containing protein n=1 Tax=Teratosphaeria destructans TaxID=418781 RepID=A0A9W7SPZ5_9PEZI|nr:hypothetical protein Tdes44962_MAKER03444 [Teratosphaeria destructans]